MSFISLLFGRRNAGAVIGGLTLDATVSENHERSSDVTDSAIESGSMVSDHVIRNPERVTIEGFVTDAPPVVLGGFSGRGVTQDAFDKLDELWREGDPFDIDTGYKRYPDMVISSLEMPRERDGSMQFRVEARHVDIVASETREVSADSLSDDVSDAAQSVNDAGRQTTSPSGPRTEDRGSVLFNLFGG